MKKHSRLKKFNGLPHELQGLDYTYDAEVEGGEVSYTPKGAKDEFIFRKKSNNIKELEKQDKLRAKRPEGDRISDISFDAIAKQLMLDESQQLASEGIDPFNSGKDVFATGGVNYMEEPDPQYSIPEIKDTSVTPQTNGMNTASTVAGTAGNIANIGSQLIQGGEQYDQPLESEVNVMQQTGDMAAGMAGVPFYQETKMVSDLGDSLSDKGMAEDNQALTRTGDFIEGIDTFGTRMKSIDAADKGIITKGENVGVQALSFLGGPWGQMFLGEKEKQYYDNQEKQAGYNDILNERGLLPQSNEIVRNRTQEFKNGGMKKKYQDGTVRDIYNQDEYIDPSLGYEGLNTDYLRGMLPEAVIDGNKSYSGVNEPIDQDVPYIPKKDMDNPVLYPEISDYTTAPQNDNSQKDKFKFDPNMLSAITGGLAQTIPSIAYLAGDGKDYDRVKYPTYRPDRVTADLPLRETRDAFASARDAMRQQGRLDLGALSTLATEEAKGRSGVRENIRNVNTGMMNDAQLKNIATTIQAMNDEAANKGQYQTNKQQALQNLTGTIAGNTRQTGMMSNDELVKRRFTELFGEA